MRVTALRLALSQMGVPQAVEVEHMATGQLLVACGQGHLLPADDAHIVAAHQVLFSCIREALVHIGRHAAEPQEV